VCDPACGAGSFLLAAADALYARGLAPTEVLARLGGADLDRDAVAAARRALAEWADEHGVARAEADRVDLRVADTLLAPPPEWTRRWDLVVGNPPFLGQLAAETSRPAAGRDVLRERFPEAGPYADSAALFLLGVIDLVADGGVSVLLQPQSVLAARDTRGIRRRLSERARLVGLWACADHPFDAEVEVCAPVVRVPDHGDPDSDVVHVTWGPEARPVGTAARPAPGASWGPLLAGALGVPVVPSPPADRVRRVAELATATAGFRDEFYAVVAAARDLDEPGYDEADPRLVTVGMIDPGRLTWGTRGRRLGGRTVVGPRLDLDALARDAPKAATWVRRRLRPKVLVATQTKILEAVADPAGDVVPVTPTISVEPTGGADLWALTAALLAPPVAARAAAEHLGSGLSVGAVRWSAAAVLDVDLPVDHDAWGRGAVLARRLADADGFARADLLRRLGRSMCASHGIDPDHEVSDWWYERARRA
jgi:hypothetical protein